jgi:hypothetical protein
MRLLKWLLGLVLALGLVFAVGGMLLPDVVELQRSVRIERPPSQVYPLLNGFGRFNEWSPWAAYDPSARYEFDGPSQGVGAVLRWRGDKMEGSQTIIGVEPDRRITVALDFGASGEAIAEFRLEPAGEATDLTWAFRSDFEGSWTGRWMGLFFERLLGPDYERGLASLKQLAESEPESRPAGSQVDTEDEAADATDEVDAEAESQEPDRA